MPAPLALATLLASLLTSGPIVGAVGPDRAIVWASPATPAGAKCEIAVAGRRLPLIWDDGGRSARVTVDGLAPSTAYDYQVFVDGKTDETARGSFTTAPAAGAAFRATFALTSCMQVHRDTEQKAFKVMAEERPALLIQVGDTHYGNTTKRDELWKWNTRQRAVASYAALLRTTPTITVWDDHDYGANNSDGTLRGKEESLRTFGELWPNPGAGLDGAPGVFFRMSWGDVDIFMLDERYDRSPDMAPDDARKRMLSEAQFRWLEQGLEESRAKFKLVAGGSTLDASDADGWRLYSEDRKRFLRLLGATDGALYLSGDVHRSFATQYSSQMTGGHTVYEVVSSGVALRSSVLIDSFASLAIDTTAPDPTIVSTIITVDPEGAVRARTKTEIRLSELKAW